MAKTAKINKDAFMYRTVKGFMDKGSPHATAVARAIALWKKKSGEQWTPKNAAEARKKYSYENIKSGDKEIGKVKKGKTGIFANKRKQQAILRESLGGLDADEKANTNKKKKGK